MMLFFNQHLNHQAHWIIPLVIEIHHHLAINMRKLKIYWNKSRNKYFYPCSSFHSSNNSGLKREREVEYEETYEYTDDEDYVSDAKRIKEEDN